MSLQIWLPFNGDLHNQGLSNLQFSLANSTQTVIDDNGKIGKCFKNQGTASDGIYSNSTINLSSTLSMFCWFKFDSIGSNNINAMITQCATANKEGFILFLHKSSTTSGYLAVENGASTNLYKGSTLLQAGQWYHGGFTYDGANLKLYLNGRLDGEWNNIGGTTLNTYIGIFLWAIRADRTPPIGSSYHFAGYLNDVRIYDHCLSNKEIEEISKGLVLHYKLDNIINNIIYDCSGYHNNGQIVNTITLINNTSRYAKSTNIVKNAYIKCTPFYFNTNQWTVSHWYYKPSNPTAYECFYCLSKGNGSDANKKFAAMPNSGRIWYKGESGSISISQLQIGTWTLLTLVSNGTTVTVYQNGNSIGSFSAGTIMTDCTDLGIGVRANSAGFNTVTCSSEFNMSDFRIYATALSEDQIKELYNISAAIDNKGNIFARELVETE